ncbi:hypothetical protein KSP39_PZI007474 [Platanthera zijinensis]|uniref:Uncharacterized protein n=1 Tax=Platanthera zijinensis TaxID=2320716 RepID=A0AAP0BP10_9ASPA
MTSIPGKSEAVGDSEENRSIEDKEDDDSVYDDAESCVMGCGDDTDMDEDRGCISWRTWCLLGQEGYSAEGAQRLSKSGLSGVDEAEENKLFWETCLTDESSFPPIF